MGKYRKLIVAVIGLAALFANRYWGLDLSGTEEMAADLVIEMLTAVAVYAVPNDKA